jgi:hypothetical protein
MPQRRKTRRKAAPQPRPPIFDVRVIGVLGTGLAEVVAEDGLRLEARCPEHIDLRWLRAALSVGPVDGTAALTGPNAVLWCIFPGPEHRLVMPDLDLRGRHVRLCASEGVEIECGRTALMLDPRGNVKLRGQNVACDEENVAVSTPARQNKALPN